MIKEENYRPFLPNDLYDQIEEICCDVKTIQDEAVDILYQSRMPDATAQLNNVLQSTEEATNVILDNAAAIKACIEQSNASDESKQKIVDSIIRIYEACNFQDLTGQRIKKVLCGFGTLEARLTRLDETAKKYAGPRPVREMPVPIVSEVSLDGPQLSGEAPSQEDIDAIMAAL